MANAVEVYTGIVATASFTPAATGYGAGDLISVAQQFSFTFANGVAVPAGSMIRLLTSIVKIDAAAVISGETSYTLQCYGVTPPSAPADNATWTLASADLTAYKGSVSLGTPVDLGAALYVKTTGFDFDIQLTSTGLWGQLVTTGAFTAAAVARQVTLLGVVL